MDMQEMDAILKPFYDCVDADLIKNEFWDDDRCDALGEGLNDDFGTSSPLGEGSMGWGPVDHIGYLLEGPNSNNAHEDDEGKCKNTGLDCDPTSDDQISMFHTIAFGLDDKSDDASGLSSSKLDSDGDVVFKDKMMSEATIESTLQMLQTSVANWGSTVTSSASSPTLSLPSLMALPSVSKPNSAAAASQAASVSDVSCQLTSNADTTETTISNPSVFRLPIKQEHSYSLLISQTPGSRSQCGERIIIRRNPEKQELDDSTWSTLSPLPSSVLGSPSKLLADHFTNRVTGKTCVTSSSSLCSSSSTVTSSSSASSSLATSTLTIGKVKEEPMDADDFLAAATATVTPTRFKITNAGGLTSSRVISAACITGGPRVCRLSAANVDDGEESERRLVPIVVHKEKDYGISRLRLAQGSTVQCGSQTILLATTSGSSSSVYSTNGQNVVLSQPLNVKVESSGYSLPPSPPSSSHSSSSSSSDSEGSLSPPHHPASPGTGIPTTATLTSVGTSTTAALAKGIVGTLIARPTTTSSSTSVNSAASRPTFQRIVKPTFVNSRQPIQTTLISSQAGGSGILVLTEEEKRTLIAEGYPVPTRLPLSKLEEKSLKKIRRKIKNKISAQESRRKKKEYMDTLERKVEILESERSQYQDHIQNLETTNSSLMAKVQNLRRQLDQLSGGSPAKIARRSLSTQTGVTLPANDRVDGSAKSEVLDVPQQRRVMPLLRKQVNGATVELESS